MSLRIDSSHRRYNPLLDEWVLTSPQRLERPWQGRIDEGAKNDRATYDPECYLCPGNTRASGKVNPGYTNTYAFDNDFPAFKSSRPIDGPQSSRLLRTEGVVGTCRVLCFSPRHDLALSRMTASGVRAVVDAWSEETERATRHAAVRYVQIFENRGELMGCSNPHPHCQLWAVNHVPTIPARKQTTQRLYYKTHDRDLLGDYLDVELTEGERIVSANEGWVALVPFWAVWPFEIMVVPRRYVAGLIDLSADERASLATIVADVTKRYDALFDCEFPYSMGWHGQPSDGTFQDGWRLHAAYYPPLLRSATVRKFLVGYEMTAEPQRDLTAEEAAARLRTPFELNGGDPSRGQPS